ncbi:MAG: hypothetical protein SGI83_18855 [Bacteroidota bacterium]|nr:hypothetical protein [Bacteroidota bacterium]
MPHTWVGDAVIVLKAPNGKILNLDYLLSSTFGTGPTTGLVNTIISSAGSTSLNAGINPYTGTFKPDAILSGNPQAGPNGYIPNVNNFTSLYSIPNGNWTLALYDGGPGDVGTLTSWSISIDYTLNGSWTQKANFAGIARAAAVSFGTATKGYIGTGSNLSSSLSDVYEYDPAVNTWALRGVVGARADATGFAISDQLYFGLGLNGSNFINTFTRLSPYWEVRNTTGDYDEEVQTGSGTCFEYPLTYDGTWRGYIECPAMTPGCYAGFSVNSLQNLGNICYKSRVDASASPRGGYGWYGGAVQEDVRLCRRNLRVEFANQPVSPVAFRIFFTKAELDALITSFQSTYGISKSYSDFKIIKYSGGNQDLDPSNNSGVNINYEQITPVFTFYGSSNQYVYAEINVSSYSEFYLALSSRRYYSDADSDGFGNPNIFVVAETALPGYVADNTDCNDAASSVHPGATEIQTLLMIIAMAKWMKA